MIQKPPYFKNYNSWAKGNTFKFGNLTNQRVVPEFVNSIKRLFFKFDHKHIILDFSEVDKIYAYPTTAIAGYIYYFKEKLGVTFMYPKRGVKLKLIRCCIPILVSITPLCLDLLFENCPE